MKLEISGWKATDRSVEIDGRVLLCAPNGTGKSAVADALRFAALGYVPHLGKRPMDTAALVRGATAWVRLTLDDGRWCMRLVERKGKGWSQSAQCSWLDATASADEHSAAIMLLFGGEEQEIAERLDIRGLLSATASERAKRLQRLLDSATRPDSVARIIARRAMISLAGVEKSEAEIPPADEDYAAVLRPIINPARYEVFRRAMSLLPAQLSDNGLQGALDWVNGEKRRAANELKQSRAARAEIEPRLASLPQPNVARIGELEAEQGRLQQEIGAARERNEKIAAAIESAREAVGRRDAAAEAHAAAKAAVDAHIATGVELSGLREKLAAIEAAMAAMRAPEPPTDDEAAALEEQARALDEQARAIEIPAELSTATERVARDHLQRLVAAAEASPWSEVARHAERIGELSIGNGGRVAELRGIGTALADLARANGGDVERLREELGLAEEALSTVSSRAEDVAATRTVRAAERAALERRASELRAEAVEARKSARIDYDAAKRTYDVRQHELATERASLARQISEHERASKDVAARLANAARELELARQHADDVREPEDEYVDTVELQARLDDIQYHLANLRRAEATAAELRRILADIERREAEAKVFGALEDACKSARAEALTASGGPLVAAMDQVLAGAGTIDRAYLEASELGFVRGESRVPVQALCAAEWTLFCAALVAGMYSLSRSEIRLLLIECAECDRNRLAGLLDGIASSDAITHAVAMTWVQGVEAPGWTVEHLGGERQREAA